MDRFQRRMQLQLGMLNELGYKAKPQDVLLDFGCGSSGYLVQEYRKQGYQAFGCSFHLNERPDVLSMRQKGILRLLTQQPYKVPFGDNIFDVIVSDQVFEHVQSYSSALSEIKRLLKPGGISLHIFVSRYRPIEAHTGVPFGSLIHKEWWYLIWAYLRTGKGADKTGSRRELARRNYNYVRHETNYLTKSEIRNQFNRHFDNKQFCEGLFLKHHHRLSFMHPFVYELPFIASLFSTFHSRVIFFRKPAQ